MPRLFLAFCVLVVTGAFARADEPKTQEPEKIPAPKAKVEPSTTTTIVPYIPRTDTREVWQHYGVSGLGRFVPRVITTPHGDYYSRTLDPYPWTPNRPSAVRP